MVGTQRIEDRQASCSEARWRMDSSRSSDPRIGFSPRPERALGWWEPATLHPAHVRPREEPIAKLGHGQEAGVGAEPLDGGKARIAAKEVEV